MMARRYDFRSGELADDDDQELATVLPFRRPRRQRSDSNTRGSCEPGPAVPPTTLYRVARAELRKRNEARRREEDQQ